MLKVKANEMIEEMESVMKKAMNCIDLSDLADFLADAEKDQIGMVLSCIKLYKLSIDMMKEQTEIIDRLDDRTEKLVSQNEELMGKLNKLDELDGDIKKILQQVSKKS